MPPAAKQNEIRQFPREIPPGTAQSETPRKFYSLHERTAAWVYKSRLLVRIHARGFCSAEIRTRERVVLDENNPEYSSTGLVQRNPCLPQSSTNMEETDKSQLNNLPDQLFVRVHQPFRLDVVLIKVCNSSWADPRGFTGCKTTLYVLSSNICRRGSSLFSFRVHKHRC